MENAVIYARYSSAGQNEQSIDGQLRVCREFAENKGFSVIKTYIDKAKSAWTESEKRVDFQKMLNDAESGAFKHIIVYKFDRFSRSRVDSMMYKAQLKKKHGVRVLSATEPVSDDEGGEIYEMFLEWNDEKYSQRLSKRVRDGLDTSVANGTFCGGTLIFGYKIRKEAVAGKNDKYIKYVDVDEDAAQIIRYAFTEYAKGVEKKDIAAALNKDGKTYNGKKFLGRTLDKWLTNEKYTGEFYFGERLSNNMYPQIIDRATFDLVQERLARNKYFSGANSSKEPYLLQGRIYCGHCGEAMVAGGGTNRWGTVYKNYECKNHKRKKCDKKIEKKDLIEFLVVSRVVNWLKDKAWVNRMAEDLISYYNDRTSDESLRSVEVRIVKAEQDIEKMTNSFIEATSSLLKANIEKKMKEYEIMLDDLTTQKKRLEIERGLKIKKEDIVDFCSELIAFVDEHNKEHQKKIIDNLVKLVYVYDSKIVVFFNLKGDSNGISAEISLEETNAGVSEVLGSELTSHYSAKTLTVKKPQNFYKKVLQFRSVFDITTGFQRGNLM